MLTLIRETVVDKVPPGLSPLVQRIESEYREMPCLRLTASQAQSAAIGLGYIALFGIGSMIGMGALSLVIAVPLVVSARWLSLANSGLQGAVGAVTIAIGISTIITTTA